MVKAPSSAAKRQTSICAAHANPFLCQFYAIQCLQVSAMRISSCEWVRQMCRGGELMGRHRLETKWV